ncbi:DegT/DnrJ/EryC1/StrS family aminotransferase [Desulfovibrio subterraneus]|uniref:DegT/DnrJ/EryC1/StrS family aminotransferase n=1 Tax=Desulfovibrio subterraneus TaxID=2718620 RepID=UPI0022B93B48|nr:DegT/DnrJ/EryC1/StrS family aminotransferase [Desulfovibrio subterraneus]
MSTQNRIYLSPPHMGGKELEFVQEAFASNFIAPLGPMVTGFENDFAALSGIPHCAALSSGTAALHIAMRQLGISAGDIVLASSLTFIGSVSPITFMGAEPVFIDSDHATWNMDPNLLEDAVKDYCRKGKTPAAVVVTDLYGQCADYDALRSVLDRNGIPLVIDAAESVGATYKDRHAGKGGACAAFSFNGNKIITTSGGGLLAAEDEAFITRSRWLSQQARETAPHYEHREIGYNYRMSNIVAAIGRGQLIALPERVRQKRALFDKYVAALGNLPGIRFMPEAAYGEANRWLTVMLVNEKEFGASPETIRLALDRENIESRPVWKPMHMQPVFKDCDNYGGSVCESLFAEGLCLPSGTAMTDADFDRIIALIKGCAGDRI